MHETISDRILKRSILYVHVYKSLICRIFVHIHIRLWAKLKKSRRNRDSFHLLHTRIITGTCAHPNLYIL